MRTLIIKEAVCCYLERVESIHCQIVLNRSVKVTADQLGTEHDFFGAGWPPEATFLDQQGLFFKT
jgi:hypothetical protein